MTGTDPTTTKESPPPIPELVALGQRFKAAREARGLELQDLALRLCIGHEQLQALERADISRMPELVFVIAQLRRVAASLGVDPEEAIAVLRSTAQARATPSSPPSPRRPQVASAPAARPSRAPHRGEARSIASLPAWPWVAGAGLLLSAAAVGLGLAWQRGSLPLPGNDQTNSTVLRDREASGTAAAGKPSPPLRPAPTLPPAVPPHLVLRSKEASWLEVRDRQGATLFEGTLQGEKSFPLGQGLQVMAGRPDLVQAELPGQQARVLGPINQVVWRSFPAAPQQAGAAAAASSAPPSPTAPAP